MKYGLALVAEHSEHKNQHSLSLGCEYLTLGMIARDTHNRKVLGEFWFDTERDRQACVLYTDAVCKATATLRDLAPAGAEFRVGGVA